MIIKKIKSSDGTSISALENRTDKALGSIILIMPFGLKSDISLPFFEVFSQRYNIITWESRHILESENNLVRKENLTMEGHVEDLLAVKKSFQNEKCILVGYCSGAGVALSASVKYPDLFENLVLINGDYVLLKQQDCMTQHGLDIDSLLPLASTDLSVASSILEKINFSDNNANENSPEGIHLPFTKATYFYRYAMNYLSYKKVDFPSLAKSNKLNSLVIASKNDKQTNVNASEYIHKLCQFSTFHIDQEGDHYELLRRESSTLQFLKSYLDQEFAYETEC